MSKKDIVYDFSNLKAARKFIREFRFANGDPVETLVFPNGFTVNVLTADDITVSHYANVIYKQFFETGYGYLEDTELH